MILPRATQAIDWGPISITSDSAVSRDATSASGSGERFGVRGDVAPGNERMSAMGRRQLMLDPDDGEDTAATGTGRTRATTTATRPAISEASRRSTTTVTDPGPTSRSTATTPVLDTATLDDELSIEATEAATTPSLTSAVRPSTQTAGLAGGGGVAGTVNGATGGGSGTSDAAAEAPAPSGLVWWQIVCIVAVGALASGVAGYVWWRRRKKTQVDDARRKQVEKEEQEEKDRKEKKDNAAAAAAAARKVALKERERKGSRHDYYSDGSYTSEDYDSVSDGGTIRPRRRRRRRGRHHRDRGRRRHGHRHRRRHGYSDYSSDSDDSYSSSSSYDRNRNASRHRTPIATPVKSANKSKDFRDSVFSTFQSMRNAAVRLKQSEAENRLAEKLDEEQQIETERLAARSKRVQQANNDIKKQEEWEVEELKRERAKLAQERLELETMRASQSYKESSLKSNNSQEPLIPPAHTASTSSLRTPASSTRSRDQGLPLPTPRRQQTGPGGDGPRAPSAAYLRTPRQPVRAMTNESHFPPRHPEGSQIPPVPHSRPTTQASHDIGKDLRSLLGAKTPHHVANRPQAVEVKPTRERPTIPPGMLQPAPQGRKASAPQKWADPDPAGGGGLLIPPVGQPAPEPVTDWGSHPMNDHGWGASLKDWWNGGSNGPEGGGNQPVLPPIKSDSHAPQAPIRRPTGAPGVQGSDTGGGGKWADRLRNR